MQSFGVNDMHQNCEDERAEQVVKMTRNTCLLALDKTLYQIAKCKSYALSASLLIPVCDAINRAVVETGKIKIYE